MRYRIFDTTVSEDHPFGRWLTEEETMQVFREVFSEGETFGHTQTDGSWEATLREL